MQIAILQLSDIHIKTDHDPILSRAQLIKEAFHESAPLACACIVVLSGDIAYSGLISQYDSALSFLDQLRDLLLALQTIKSVYFFTVPGNHDCDFSHESDVRQFLLRDIRALYDSSPSPSGDSIKAILAVQQQFFAFEAKLASSKEIPGDLRLLYDRVITINNYPILFRCFNTAWLSRKTELQGKLFIPSNILTTPPSGQAQLCVSIFHHPYNWLDAMNYRQLRDNIEQTTDIVFTGHEHIGGGATVERLSGEHLRYIEGATLQGESGLLDSGFNSLLLDLSSGEQRLTRFEWNGEAYTHGENIHYSQIIKNPSRQRSLLRPNSRFFAKMTDVGSAFVHKRKRTLVLSDIYIYPDLRPRTIRQFTEKIPVLYSQSVLDYFRSTEKILIIGGDRAGKTALLKSLYVDLNTDFTPIILNGSTIQGSITEEKFKKLLTSAIEEQYDRLNVERLLQLDPARKLLLVDDFDSSNLAPQKENEFLALALDQFSHIVVTASDVYSLSSLAKGSRDLKTFDGFQQYEIKDFGHRLRGQLIRKWLSLGRETASDLASLDHDIRTTEKTIASLLGRDVVPPSPFNILTLLHAVESHRPHATIDGSYGALYELLIKSSLAYASSEGLLNVDLQMTYSSVIAYAMFSKNQPRMTEFELKKIHQEYVNRFDISPDFHRMLADLTAARILTIESGQYIFRYKHCYCYFVARYIERGLKSSPNNEELRAHLAHMVSRLHNEEFANIILFFVYVAQDEEVIRSLVSHANQIYIECELFDFESHVEFVNRLYKEPPKMLIADLDIDQHQEDFRHRLDQAEEVAEENQMRLNADGMTAYSKEMDDIHKINIAFKTIQVLGQVLRSAAGTMEGPTKREIAAACCLLGLRTLRAIMRLVETDIEGFRVYLALLIKERAAVVQSELSEGELLKLTDEAVIWLAHLSGYGVVRKVSYAIGHRHLADTYEKIYAEHGDHLGVGLIDLSIKLEHFAGVPSEFDVARLRDKTVQNLFAYSVLRQLITDFLYLFRVDVRTLQRFGSMFKIEGATSPLVLPGDKKK